MRSAEKMEEKVQVTILLDKDVADSFRQHTKDTTPDYQTIVNQALREYLEAKSAIEKALSDDGDSATLRDAYKGQEAPTESGVYKLCHHGELMRIGKAEDGLRKRFSDYYRGPEGGTAGLKYINLSNKDEVNVWWVCLPRKHCQESERALIQEAIDQGEKLRWMDNLPKDVRR